MSKSSRNPSPINLSRCLFVLVINFTIIGISQGALPVEKAKQELKLPIFTEKPNLTLTLAQRLGRKEKPELQIDAVHQHEQEGRLINSERIHLIDNEGLNLKF